MASVQELDTQVRVLEDKVTFLLAAIRIQQASPLVGYPPRVLSLGDVYSESKRAGLVITDRPDQDPGPIAETEPSNAG